MTVPGHFLPVCRGGAGGGVAYGGGAGGAGVGGPGGGARWTAGGGACGGVAVDADALTGCHGEATRGQLHPDPEEEKQAEHQARQRCVPHT